jgi:hypothetical protein
VFGIMVKKPVQLKGAEGPLVHDPFDRGVGFFLQKFTPHETSQDVRVEPYQALEILTVFLPDILAHLGVPTPPRFKVLQRYQIVESCLAQLFLLSTL